MGTPGNEAGIKGWAGFLWQVRVLQEQICRCWIFSGDLGSMCGSGKRWEETDQHVGGCLKLPRYRQMPSWGGNLAGWKQQLGLCGRREVMKNDGTCCETLRSEDLS